jgi:DNA mismatch repair protein MutS2
LNNEIYSLEQDETREVQRILRALTADLAPYSSLLLNYAQIVGQFDFIRAKALLAIDMNGNMPQLQNKAGAHLINAYHPLLFLYNKVSGKKTIPVNIELDDDARILIISGPNAGGKTVSMKTLGLNQVMMQSGLLVPMSELSEMGIYKQLFIQLGDTQNLAFELSTYSSHLMHMKHFIENANGKTLFFIDELGSGSDPHLGGAFAEVILEELSHRNAQGIVTTHYLNLKVMANHNKGIVNGAMQFDEVKLEPLYQLVIGKPGSSYTFAIAGFKFLNTSNTLSSQLSKFFFKFKSDGVVIYETPLSVTLILPLSVLFVLKSISYVVPVFLLLKIKASLLFIANDV